MNKNAVVYCYPGFVPYPSHRAKQMQKSRRNVDDVSNIQRFNSYTYANNNPMRFTDPTGYDGWAIPEQDGGGWGSDPFDGGDPDWFPGAQYPTGGGGGSVDDFGYGMPWGADCNPNSPLNFFNGINPYNPMGYKPSSAMPSDGSAYRYVDNVGYVDSKGNVVPFTMVYQNYIQYYNALNYPGKKGHKTAEQTAQDIFGLEVTYANHINEKLKGLSTSMDFITYLDIGLFYLGEGTFVINLFSDLKNKDYNAAIWDFVDITMLGIMETGDPYGIAIGGLYFIGKDVYNSRPLDIHYGYLPLNPADKTIYHIAPPLKPSINPYPYYPMIQGPVRYIELPYNP